MKTTNRLGIAAALCAVWLAGCSTPASRIQANPEAFAQLTPQQQAAVRAGRVGIGYSMDAVKMALGDPDRVTMRTDGNGDTQVWHYTGYMYYDTGYLYAYYPGIHRHWGWGGWGGFGGPGAGEYAFPYDRYRIEFKDGKVVSIQQEASAY